VRGGQFAAVFACQHHVLDAHSVTNFVYHLGFLGSIGHCQGHITQGAFLTGVVGFWRSCHGHNKSIELIVGIHAGERKGVWHVMGQNIVNFGFLGFKQSLE